MENSWVVIVTVTGSAGGTGPGLLGRLARLVVTSLVVSGCGGLAQVQLCAEDEFYDAVVGTCALCSDVCDLCLWPESHSFCSRNCPEFYAKLQRSKTGCAHTKQSLTPARLPKESKNADNSPSTSSPSSSWSTNPLMLTTIVALSIAVVATLVILPLVLCVQVRQRCTGKREPGAPGAPDARQQNTSSAGYNAVENGTATAPSKLSSSPIYVPQNELKEKSGVEWSVKQGLRMVMGTIHEDHVASLVDCLNTCVMSPVCDSANFRPTDETCQHVTHVNLLSVNSTDLVPDTDWQWWGTYFTTWIWM